MSLKDRTENIEVTITLIACLIDQYMPPDGQRELAGTMSMFMTNAKRMGHDIQNTLDAMEEAQEAICKARGIEQPTPNSKIILPH